MSCLCQQMFMVLETVAYLSAHERVLLPSPINGGVKHRQMFLEEVSAIRHQRQIYFLQLWGLACNFWVLCLHVLCRFFTQQFVASLSIEMVQYCDITQLMVEPDRLLVWSTMERYKCHNRAGSFMYSNLCTSVTTKMNSTRCAKNTNDCGKYNFSAS